MHIVVAGASGFLGQHLVEALRERDHTVTKLVRRDPGADDESRWDPANHRVDAQVIQDADVVVNLAGSPTIGNPHSQKWAHRLRESRVTTTRTLAEAIAGSSRRPAFLAGNAVAIYGDHGPQQVTEDGDSRGHSLMTEVTREWEAAAGSGPGSAARSAAGSSTSR
jgi:NAD dependent epimerase/dehydratase family enzyme